MSGTNAPRAPEQAPEQTPEQTPGPARPGGAPLARASDGGPPRPVWTGGPASSGPSRTEWLAAGLKLASALCALAAVGLVVRPLLLGELSLKPRMLTLQPTFSQEPVAAPRPVAAEPETPAPQEPPPGSVVREERADFDGSVLMIDSEPSGATVLVDGRDQGETPVSVGLECLPGTPVIVSMSLRGYERAKHTTLCPHDALVKVTAQLKKSSGKASGKK